MRNDSPSMRYMVLKTAVATAILPMMAGCATFHQAQVDQSHAEQSIAHYQPPKPPPVVSTVATPYLMGTMVDVQHAVPDILQQSITLVYTTPLTLRQIAEKITQKKGIPVHVEDTSPTSGAPAAHGGLPPLPGQAGGGLSSGTGGGIHLDWHGSIAGLLDMVTAREGVRRHLPAVCLLEISRKRSPCVLLALSPHT